MLVRVEMQKRFGLALVLLFATVLASTGQVACAGLIAPHQDSAWSTAAQMETEECRPVTGSAGQDSSSTGDERAPGKFANSTSLLAGNQCLDSAGGMAPPSPDSFGGARGLAV